MQHTEKSLQYLFHQGRKYLIVSDVRNEKFSRRLKKKTFLSTNIQCRFRFRSRTILRTFYDTFTCSLNIFLLLSSGCCEIEHFFNWKTANKVVPVYSIIITQTSAAETRKSREKWERTQLSLILNSERNHEAFD